MEKQPNNNIPESIWADGIPANIKDEDRLTGNDLLGLAIDYVMNAVIIEKGFKIERTFPRITPPQIICKRDGVVYAIVVGVAMFPETSWLKDDFRLDFYNKSIGQKIVPLFAPVSFESIDKARAEAKIALKGDVFKNHFPGLIKITGEERVAPNEITPDDFFKA